jgi:hypothetical protein
MPALTKQVNQVTEKELINRKPGNVISNSQCLQTVHQQVKLTHFFPGRPPEKYHSKNATQAPSKCPYLSSKKPGPGFK